MTGRDIFISVDLKDLSWATPLIEKFGLGIEIVDFSRPFILDHAFNKTLEEWHRVLEKLPSETRKMLHGPFYDLYPFSRDEKLRLLAQERYRQASRAAQILGCKSIVFHSGYLPCISNPDYSDAWIEGNYPFWCDLIREFSSLNYLIENMWDPRPAHLMTLCKKVNSDRLGICFDIGHANAYSKLSAHDWLEMLGASVHHVHANDNHGAHDEELALGAGTVDSPTLGLHLGPMSRVGITIEVIGYEGALQTYNVIKSLHL